jgi:dipeptidyl aminopeptidase/acylaminoacyl peptidase
VPYSQAVRLQDALAKAGTKSELYTVAGGGHGNFSPEQRSAIYLKIRQFLAGAGFQM